MNRSELERVITSARCIEAAHPEFTCECRPRKHVKCAAEAVATRMETLDAERNALNAERNLVEDRRLD